MLYAATVANLRRLLLLSILIISISAVAQFDTRFWMPPVWDVSVTSQNDPSELFITTPFPSPVAVHIQTPDGTTFVLDTTVVSGAPLQVVLTAALGQTDTPNSVMTNNGFLVTAEAPIQCVHKVAAQLNQTLVTLKGANGLGREFWCGSQVRNGSGSYGPNEHHFISVMATENNTQITFNTPFDMWDSGGTLPNPYVLTLNANECYLIRGDGPQEHVCGALVTGDKDIIVNSGSSHTRIAGGGAADGGSDQLVPIGLMGQSYAAIKGDNNDPFDYVVIVATVNNTDIFVDGGATAVANIDAGEYYDYTMAGAYGAPHYFATSEIAYCYHVTGASQDDEVGMSAIPRLLCTGSRYIEFSKFDVNTTNQVMNVIATDDALATLTLNGVGYAAVPDAVINVVPGLPTYTAISFPESSLADDNVLTSNGFFHAGFLTGNGGATGTYGFLSGFDDAFDFMDPSTGIPTTIYTLPAMCQGEQVDHCIEVYSCGNDHNITAATSTSGAIITITPPTMPFDTCFNYIAPFNYTGNDTLNITITNSAGFEGNVDIVIQVLDPDTPINAGTPQELCDEDTGTLSAIDPDPFANGQWSVLGGGSALITDPTSPTTAVTNLQLGTNSFLWTQFYPCGNNIAITQITVFEGNPPEADAGADVELCSDNNTFNMLANDPGVTATGTWEVTSGTATVWDINDPNALITNLAIGQNDFEWNIDNGDCAGDASDDPMSIFVFDQSHPQSDAGADQDFCDDVFIQADISGSTPVFPATGEWQVVSGSGTFDDSTNPDTFITGLGTGVNVFSWVIDNGTCGTLTDEITITLFDATVASPNAGPNGELCTPTTSWSLVANEYTLPAVGTWAVSAGSGVFSNDDDGTTTVTNLSIGANTFTWTLDNGPCSNTGEFDEVTIIVYDGSQIDADAGANQEFCSDVFVSTTLDASSVTAPGTGLWTVVQGSGDFADDTDPTTSVDGLSNGINEFQWTVGNGPCNFPTLDTVMITIFDNSQGGASAGTDVEFCTPISTHTMDATPVPIPAQGEWTLESGTGTIDAVNDPNSNISGLGVGVNVFRWSIVNGPCPSGTNFDEMIISIFDENVFPAAAGPDQDFCFSPAVPLTATMAASAYVAPGAGTWAPISGGGNITDPTDPTTTITSLPIGINVFEWTVTNGPCVPTTTSDQISIFVFDNNQDLADAGPDQNVCSDTPDATMAANAVTSPGVGVWTTQAGGGTIADENDPTTEITAMPVGTNVFRWSIDNGPCVPPTTLDEVTILVFDASLVTALAGPDQDICSDQGTVTMAANTPISPATGLWMVTQGSGTFDDDTDPDSDVSAIGIGVNIFEWQVNNGPCSGSTSDQMSVSVFDQNQNAADAGPDQEFCTPILTATMAANTITTPGTGTWALMSGTGTVTNVNDPNSGVTGLTVGENIFSWTVGNGPCVPSTTTDQVSIFIFDGTAPVADAGLDQSYCAPVSSTTMTGNNEVFPATGQWVFVSGSGTIVSPSSPNTQITDLAVGENIFEWQINSGPCPDAVTTDQVSVFIFDQNQNDAGAGPDQIICTPTSSVTMAGNSITFPATGTWTIVSGSGTITDDESPTTSITDLPVGEHVFQWEVDNGACGPPTTDTMTIKVFDSAAAAADAGPDQELCTPVTSTNFAGNAAIFPGTGMWTMISGSGSITDDTDPTSLVTGLGIGENVFEWTIDNGPCGATTTSDQVSIFVFFNGQAPASAGTDQDICSDLDFAALTANSVTFPATGEWMVLAGTGNFSSDTDPNATVTGMTIGENIFQWEIINDACGLPTTDTVSIFLYDTNHADSDAGPDQEFCTPSATTNMGGSVPTFPAVGTWELVSGVGGITDENDPNSGITGLTIGENIFRWTIDNGPCDPSSTVDLVSIFIFDGNAPLADAGTDQEFCTPVTSTTLFGNNAIFPATGSWSLVSGTGTLVNANNPNTQVNGLTIGENVFMWSIDSGPCPDAITTDLVSIFIYDENQPDADAGAAQIFCSPISTATMAGSSITFPGSGQWTLISGTGTITDDANPLTGITAMSIGENIFEWTVDNGPCASATSDQVSLFVYDDAAPDAAAGLDQDLCTPTTSTNMTANSATDPGVGTWTLVSGSGSIIDENDPTTLITGLAVGANVFQWEIDNGGCSNGTTNDLVSIFVYFDGQADAAAGPDQDLCTPITSTFLAANGVTFPATGTWALISGVGTIVDDTAPNTEVTGLGIGINIFVWTIDNGPCPNTVTTDQVSISLFDGGFPEPDAGPDQELCSPTSGTFMAADPAVLPGIGTWTLVSGSGIPVSPNDPNTAITGLTIGVSTFAWTMDYATCGQPQDEVDIIVYDSTVAPSNAGPDQEVCTPTSSVNMAADAIPSPGEGTWSVASGNGTFVDLNDPTTQVDNLPVGENIFVWNVYNGPCLTFPNTVDSISVFVFDQLQPVADAGVDQIFCSPISTATLDGNSVIFPGSGSWTVTMGAGTVNDPTDPQSGVTGMSIGENIFQWEIDNGPCGAATNDLVSIFIYDDNAPDADAGPDQDLCTPMSTATMVANSAILPAIGTWTLISGTGVITDANNPTTGITGLTVGENVFQWTIDNGPCAGTTTADLVSIFVYDENQLDADAGPDQDLCTPQSSTFLAGNAITFPATGTWALVSGTGTIFNTLDPNTEVTGLAIGQNVFEWTVDNGPCANGITTDQVIISLFDGDAPEPEAGDDQELCSPTTSAFLTADAALDPGIGTWTLVSGSGIFTDPNDPLTEVTAIAIGINTFMWSIDYATCGTVTDTVNIIIYDSTVPPANAGPDQDICLPTTSTTMAAAAIAPPGDGTWTLSSGTGTITDVNDPNSAIDNLTVGENIFVWTVYNGPCLLAPNTTDTISIFVFDNLQDPADAGEDQEWCTPISSTNLDGNPVTFPAFGTWTLASGTGTITDPNDPFTEVTGILVGEGVFTWTIVNGSCPGSPTSDDVSIFIFDENQADADAGPDQMLCTPVSNVTLDGNELSFPASGEWVLLNGTGTILDPTDPNTVVTGVVVGESVFQWTISNGPCDEPTSDVMSIFIFDQFNNDADAGPNQEICTPESTSNLEGNVPVFPAIGTWTLVGGTGVITNPNDPATEVTGLTVGENVFMWSVDNGPCANGVTTDTISIFVFDEFAPLADAGPDQEFCTPVSSTLLNATTPLFPGSGSWTLVGGTGIIVSPTDPNTQVTGLTIGENIFEWLVYNGPCATTSSTDQVSVFIFDEAQLDAAAGADQQLCLPSISTLLNGNPVTFPAVGTWAIITGSAAILGENDPNTLVTDLAIGTNTFVWTVENGPCLNSLTTDTVIIELFDNDFPEAYAGEDQEWCLPTNFATLDADDLTDPVTGIWTVIQGGGDILDPTNDITAVTNIPVGENIYEWTIDNGPCGATADQVSIFIYDPDAPIADAGLDQEFCTPVSTAVMAGNTPGDPGVGTWELVGGTGTIGAPNSPATDISGLTIGENIFTWSIYNGPCADPTIDSMSVFIFDENHPPAFAGNDVELCLPLDSLQMDGSDPIFPAGGTWELIGGSATIDEINNPDTWVDDLQLGTNTFVWTIGNLPCIDGVTSDTINVLVFHEDFPAPFAGDDQAFCSPIATTVLEADALEDPNTGEWSVNMGSGVFGDDTDPNTIVSGLTVGINEFVWSVYNGPCLVPNVTDTVQVLIYDESHPPAAAGDDQELCLPTSTTLMNGTVPIVPAIGTWVLVSGGGDVFDVNDPNTVVTNLPLGINVFSWTIENGPCENSITTDLVTITVYEDGALDAFAGEDIEICTPETCVLLDATPPSVPTVGTWTWVQGGGTISDINDPNAEVCALVVGHHILQWEVYNGPCAKVNTFDFVDIFVFDITNLPAYAGEDQELCWPSDSTGLEAATPIFPAMGTWTLIAGIGDISDLNNPNADFTDSEIGTNILTWSVYNGPCADPTIDTVIITIFDPLSPDADAGEDQWFCTPFSGATMAGNVPIDPAEGTWELISGTGDISQPNIPTTMVLNLGLGQNILTWSIYNGACANSLTIDTVNIYVNDATVAEANAGPDLFFCGTLDSLQMDGSETIGNTAFGIWTTITGGGTFADLMNEHTFVYDIPLGLNTYVWTVDNGACGITSDTIEIWNFDPELPAAFAGPDQEFCEDEFDPFDLDGSQISFPANAFWEIFEGPIVISDDLDPNATVNYLGDLFDPDDIETSTLVWTVDNGVCGTSSDSVTYVMVDCLSIEVPDAFSPNGDGVNDVWEIPNLFKYPNNSVQIYNRWGALLYEASPYWENWDGRSHHPATMGTELPVSTYYWIIDLGDGSKQITGWVYLKR